MVRYGESYQWYNAHLNNGLSRVKGISSKRCWIDRQVVYLMHVFKNGLPVHQSVRPVKIGVVQKDHQDDAEKEIEVAMLIDIVIDPCITLLARNNGKNNDRTENQCAQHRITDLPQDMLVFRVSLLDLCIPEFPVLPNVKNKVKYSGKQKIT